MRRYALIAAAWLALISPAKAADTVVSSETAASALGGGELLYCVQSAADRKCTPTQISAYVFGLVSGDLTFNGSGVGTITKVNGVSFPSSFTSGGIPYASSSSAISSSAALTANLPVIGGGAGNPPAVGTRSGNTTAFVTTTGPQTSGDCVKIDASGNHIANGSACAGGSDGRAPTYARSGNFYLPYDAPAQMAAGTSTTSTSLAYCHASGIGPVAKTPAQYSAFQTSGTGSSISFATYSVSGDTATLVDFTAVTGNNTAGGMNSFAVTNNATLSPGVLYLWCMVTGGTVTYANYNAASSVGAKLIGSQTGSQVFSGTEILSLSFSQAAGASWASSVTISSGTNPVTTTLGAAVGYKM